MIAQANEFLNGQDRAFQEREDILNGIMSKGGNQSGMGKRASNYNLLHPDRHSGMSLKNGKKLSTRSMSKQGSRATIAVYKESNQTTMTTPG